MRERGADGHPREVRRVVPVHPGWEHASAVAALLAALLEDLRLVLAVVVGVGGGLVFAIVHRHVRPTIQRVLHFSLVLSAPQFAVAERIAEEALPKA